MGKSGGITARNTREGLRSEYIAEYIFSAFGTCIQATPGNDLGIDLICNLTKFEGKLITFKSSYGVQVKSKGKLFKYSGKQATTWLSKMEFPLLLAEIDKRNSYIKMYSTWNLNNYILGFHGGSEHSFPDEVVFSTSDISILPMPDNKRGLIPVGKPILEFDIKELGNEISRESFWGILDEWLEFDNRNYLLRRAGISCSFGYIEWETNKKLSKSRVKWDKKYFYSNHHANENKKTIAEAFISLALFYKKWYEEKPQDNLKLEFNALREYATQFLKDDLGDFGLNLFKDSI